MLKSHLHCISEIFFLLNESFPWETLCTSVSLFAWLVYVRMHCVPIATFIQNKPSRLPYLGHAQIIKDRNI